ncbi:uncharacterized protein [Amphiura filiformis]|uniref:uncharacterized protein n=1 Tax=Amphiura filiformis TaxID=82378 RepID=UPI003B213E28
MFTQYCGVLPTSCIFKMVFSCSKLRTSRYLSCIIVAIVILTLCNLTHGQACSSCTRVNDCSCKCSDGRVIDISALGKKSGGPKFTYTQPSSSLPWEFAFNPCYKFSDDYCKNVVSCQRATDKTSSYPLGTAESATWQSDGTKVTYTSIGTDGVTRTSVLTLQCDPLGQPSAPTYQAKGEDFATPAQYDYELKSICACPDGCKSSGGGGGGGLSFGSILCILFVVLVFVYIVGGMVFMKVVKKAEGKEVVPNVNFWMELPNYIKDGFLFVKNGCKGDSNYGSM